MLPEELLPLDETGDDESSVILFDDELETSDADEEMSGELDGEDADEDDSEALEDDEEEDDDLEEEDAEKADLRKKIADYEAQVRRAEYEKQQRTNQEHWDGIQAQAEEAFDWEYNQIFEQKDNYVDPDAYVRVEVSKLQGRIKDWFQRFYASQNESRRQQYERAAVPTWAAKVATHYDLTPQQAESLLDYDPKHMAREGEKMARSNAREAALKKKLQQARRGDAQAAIIAKGGNPTGGGRAPSTRIKRGSDAHLMAILNGTA